MKIILKWPNSLVQSYKILKFRGGVKVKIYRHFFITERVLTYSSRMSRS